MITRANERSARHAAKAERAGGGAEFVEFGRRNITHVRQMLGRRPQILPEREEIAARLDQIGERVEQLVARLTEAEHQPALRRDRSVEPLHGTEQFERPAIIALAAADFAIEP